jgi:hypothetical protein
VRIRNAVERTFGLLKRRWKILRSSPPEYNLKAQIRVIYAVCSLHNFLLIAGVAPSNGDEEEGLTNRERAVLEEARQQAVHRIGQKGSKTLREQITEDLWAQHEAHVL